MKIFTNIKNKLSSMSRMDLISLFLWLMTFVLLIVTISLGVSIGSNKDSWTVMANGAKKFPDVVTVFILLFIAFLFGSLIFTVFIKYKEKRDGGAK